MHPISVGTTDNPIAHPDLFIVMNTVHYLEPTGRILLHLYLAFYTYLISIKNMKQIEDSLKQISEDDNEDSRTAPCIQHLMTAR
jgi:hypothetical protein